MKLISHTILAKDASGSAKLRPEEPEDMVCVVVEKVEDIGLTSALVARVQSHTSERPPHRIRRTESLHRWRRQQNH